MSFISIGTCSINVNAIESVDWAREYTNTYEPLVIRMRSGRMIKLVAENGQTADDLGHIFDAIDGLLGVRPMDRVSTDDAPTDASIIHSDMD